MTQISSLFNKNSQRTSSQQQPSQVTNQLPQTAQTLKIQSSATKVQINIEQQQKSGQQITELNELIAQSSEILAHQDTLANETLQLIQRIEVNKGQVMANTKDFQVSCMSILKRERMLTKVVREIEKNLQSYKDYEECQRILQHSQLMEQPKELIAVLGKIFRGIDFFTQNFEYKRADLYLRRFNTLKDSALEKINLKILKVMRDANAENNLSVVQTQIFEKAVKFEDLDVKNVIYHEPKVPPHLQQSKYQQDMQQEQQFTQFETLRLFITSVEEKGNFNYEFCERIYEEYFDHRLYLIEQYLECIARIMDGLGIQTVFQYMVKYLEKFIEVFNLEQVYFERQFSKSERFSQFRSENEYDLINKKLKPYIVYSVDVINLCDAIDYLREPYISNNVADDTIKRLFSDLQERLLLISHYSLQEVLAQAQINLSLPQVVNNQDPTQSLITKENLPFQFITKLIEILQKLQKRINPDIYRGLLLEVVQRVYSEKLENLLSYESSDRPHLIEVLLLAHANIMFSRKDLLSKAQQNKSKSQTKGTSDNNSTTDQEDAAQAEEIDDEIDLVKTKENLWQLLTFSTQQYDSVFHFIDESIPTLKKKQQKDMLESLWQRLFNITQRICKVFIKETFQDIDTFMAKLKADNGPKSMSEYEKQLIFTMKYDGVEDQAVIDKYQWAIYENVREMYVDSLSRLAIQYKLFKEKLAKIQECLMFNEEGFQIYEQMKSDVRLKSLNHIQKFYTVISKHYDKGRYEQLRLKDLKELNLEIFGINDSETQIVT
ncbi:UNKNOWN [Stylonychia lemnae]|uniref:Conserved oligomeric Golgi complex subunit 3 N-terminal domain-containing protein n=1 Tax=Stylonychia lemnae TaxID=5949 RepID=A0A078A843_STYLE|nr:UNKNOWN [Stylonychia lemnae]|eukprot:CDW76946.1 UNKNOWN [Stylonychia lemnae]